MGKIKAIFIAAGMGSRLSPYTDECPKCMLPLNGKPIISNNVDALVESGVDEINVVVGYRKDKVKVEGARYFENDDFENNNILFSLMYASKVLEEAIQENRNLIVSYSDIIYSKRIVESVLAQEGDIVLAVDTDWLKLYEGRSEHPVSEAEKVVYSSQGVISKLGKGIEPDVTEKVGEFIGLFKLTPAGADKWLSHFRKLNTELAPTESFNGAIEFRKSYLTHFMQDMINEGAVVTAANLEGGWMEFDTSQDYEKLLSNYGES